MISIVEAKSGETTLAAELNFDARTWSSASERPEGDFPFIAHANGKRYELYSDHTFDEVED